MPPLPPRHAPVVNNNKPRPNPAATPAISYTPTDTTIPPSLYHKVPNLELYKKLEEAERGVDLLISRKALDFQAIQQKTIHPSNFKGETGILRVFIYNTCENQPWQKQLLQKQGLPLPDPTSAESSWTLRVEGRFLSDNKEETDSEELKFSSFLSAISIDLIPNEDYPALQNAQSNIIEWRNDLGIDPAAQKNNAASFDGLDIKRNGVFNIKSKIALLVKSHAATFKLSDEMAQFTGKHESTQQELIYLVWQYVLYKNLFRKTEALTRVDAVSTNNIVTEPLNQDDDDDDLTVVQSDDVLQNLLKVKTFKFSDLYKLLQPHFKPREPIIVDFEVNTKKSTTLGETVIDIPIELPLNLSKIQKELLDLNKVAFENLTKADNIIQQLNSRISLGIVALQNANGREKFYRELSEDPVKFIESWIDSQSETLKALKSDEGFDEEIVRRAQYFEENEHLIKEKIDLLLGSSRF
ncbi:subunit of SWI/SNF transcription activation complex [Scheffersomyces xylosifermentans]|uniref:subunit of SWI/SNF transcription activation complex n=1 Tax=Scheffersomyces xylosifermentans TaxID=1304137 RepID=UPI00315D67FD